MMFESQSILPAVSHLESTKSDHKTEEGISVLRIYPYGIQYFLLPIR